MSEYRLYRVLRDAEGKHVGNEYMGVLVTCKECKRANRELSGLYCGLSDVNMGEDGYCSIGEREGE